MKQKDMAKAQVTLVSHSDEAPPFPSGRRGPPPGDPPPPPLPSYAHSPVHPSSASAGAESSPTPGSSAASANTTGNPRSLDYLTNNGTNLPSSHPCWTRPTASLSRASCCRRTSMLWNHTPPPSLVAAMASCSFSITTVARPSCGTPLTGVQHRVPFPPVFQGVGKYNSIRSAAVLCPVDDDRHMHSDCHMSPFKLVFACRGADRTQAFVCIYESKFGVWGDIISIVSTHAISDRRPSILVGSALYWLLFGGNILEFDFERLTLAVIKKPADIHCVNAEWCFQILRGEDNGLGLAILSTSALRSDIQLWARKSNCDGAVSWMLQNTVQLDELFSRPLCPDTLKFVPGAEKLFLMPGYDEDTNVLFLASVSHDYIIQLRSMQFNYIGRREYKSFRLYYPYTHFYNAGALLVEKAELKM